MITLISSILYEGFSPTYMRKQIKDIAAKTNSTLDEDLPFLWKKKTDGNKVDDYQKIAHKCALINNSDRWAVLLKLDLVELVEIDGKEEYKIKDYLVTVCNALVVLMILTVMRLYLTPLSGCAPSVIEGGKSSLSIKYIRREYSQKYLRQYL